MKFITPLVMAATAFVLIASHPAHAASTPGPQEAAVVANASPVVVIAQTDVGSPREYRTREVEYGSPGKRGARAAAQQGPDALRRYIDRTRMIYALDYREFAKP